MVCGGQIDVNGQGIKVLDGGKDSVGTDPPIRGVCPQFW